jgi:hypothetical protein
MGEQAVKEAKAKRDAAQADLDKAVKDTKDEIEKSAAAVKDAAPEKAPVIHDPEKVDEKPVAAKTAPAAAPAKSDEKHDEKPAPLKPVVVSAVAPAKSKTRAVVEAAVGVLIAVAVIFALKHFGVVK